MDTITCPRCGTENSSDAKICKHCQQEIVTPDFKPIQESNSSWVVVIVAFIVTVVAYGISYNFLFKYCSINPCDGEIVLVPIVLTIVIAFFLVPISAVFGAIFAEPGMKIDYAIIGAFLGGMVSLIAGILFNISFI